VSRAHPRRIGPRPSLLVGSWVLALTLLAGCGGGGPVDASPAELVAQQERLDGAVVRTIGRVDTYHDPRHYWVEDRANNRTELVPHEAVEPYVGREVLVEGRFSYAEDEGRLIEVERIDTTEDDDRAVALGSTLEGP
jgi:predicted small lipoprotein YifL